MTFCETLLFLEPKTSHLLNIFCWQWLVQNHCGSLNLKPYSTISCNVTVRVTHEENTVGFVET